MDEIKRLDHGICIICGRIVKIIDGAIDLTTDAGRAKAIDLVARVAKSKTGSPYGPCTVFYILPMIDGPSGRKHVGELRSPKWLSDEIRDMLRKEMPEYAGEL